MAAWLFNVAKLRAGELVKRVNDNDPSTSRLLWVPLEASGLEAKSVLEDADTLAAVLAGTTNEQTTMGRVALTDAEVPDNSPDDTNNRYDYDLPDPAWAAATGNAIGALVLAYDPASSADSAIIPLAYFDCAMTPDGSNFTAVVNAAGVLRGT